MHNGANETMGRVVGIRVNRSDRDMLAMLAQRRRTTKSTVIRQLIAEEVRRVGLSPERFDAAHLGRGE